MEKQKTDVLLKDLLRCSWAIEESTERLVLEGEKNIAEFFQHINEFHDKNRELIGLLKENISRFKVIIENLEPKDKDNFSYFLNHVEPRINDLDYQINLHIKKLTMASKDLSEIVESLGESLRQIGYKNPI